MTTRPPFFMFGGAFMTASTLSPDTVDTFLALWTGSIRTRGPFNLSSSRRPMNWRSPAVKLEMVLDGRLKDWRMLSIFMDGDDVEEDSSTDVDRDLNLALFRTALVSDWLSTLSLSPSLESSNKERSDKTWLLNLLPRALILTPESLGEILTRFIFRFLKPVSLCWNSLERWVVVDDDELVVIFWFLTRFLSAVLLFLNFLPSSVFYG